MSLAALGVSALGAAALAPAVAEALRTPMTPARQSAAPGRIAKLPGGATHVTWSGPAKGPVAVCIHGLSTPSYVFAGTARSLASLGFRVLTYDLYGRGFSDRPKGRQDTGFFLAQLRALLDHEGVTGPVTVLGYSMGGVIGAAFAAAEGPRVDRLVLLAPAGLSRFEPRGLARLWTAPLAGDWLMRVAGGWALRRDLGRDPHIATLIPDLAARQMAETRMRGFLPALLSSRRHCLSADASGTHREIRLAGTPVLAIWGADDRVIPLTAMGRLAACNPEAHHVQIAGAGHGFPQTHPREVAEALAAFLG